jgi:hypothetical protein
MSWHRHSTKYLYTLCVDNYAPQITDITFPLLKHWAAKHRYTFHVIDQRLSPQYPPVMEKFQCFNLVQHHQAEYAIFIDADALVHPDMFDPWEHIPKDHVFHNGHDFCNLRWTVAQDRFFKRDGRMLAGGNWLTGATDLTYDIWAPQDDLTIEEAIKNITPLVMEKNTVIEAAHLIDDYLTSRNIAKYGLKFAEIGEICKRIGVSNYMWHQYIIGVEEKALEMKKILQAWRLA